MATYTSTFTSSTSSSSNDSWGVFEPSNKKVYKVMDDHQLYDYCDTKKSMSKKSNEPNFEKKYEEIKDKEIVKLLESMDIVQKGIAVPIIVLVPTGKEDKSLGFFESLSVKKKYPSVVAVATITDELLEDTKELKKSIFRNFESSVQFGKLAPMVVMIDIFNKDQSIMEQSILMKSGVSLLSTFQKVLAGMKRKKKVEFEPEPLIIINNSLGLDDLEESSMMADVLEMEEVKEDNLSYIKLTF